MIKRRAFLAAALIAHASLNAAGPAFSEENAWPRHVHHAKGTLVLANKPTRIVSTAPSLTGILLAIGAPVVASAATTPSGMTDSRGFFSQWSNVAQQQGVEVLYSNLVFDIEAVIGLAPDLIVGSATGADSITQHFGELERQELPAIIVDYANHSWQDVARTLGQATGREIEAERAIRNYEQYAADASADIIVPEGAVSIVGYNIGGSYSIGKAESAQADVLKSMGMTASGLPETLKSKITRSSDFDFISHENLAAAISGETVFLLRATEKDVEAFLRDPVLANLPAVRNHRVFPLGQSSFRVDYYSGLEMIDLVKNAMQKR